MISFPGRVGPFHPVKGPAWSGKKIIETDARAYPT